MLFNKDGNGAVELHRLTGTYPASNSYESILSDIMDAAMTVGSVIGHDIVANAEELYEAASAPVGQEAELLRAVQSAVAAKALAEYAKGNLVTHDDSGAKIKVDENERVAFEWMVDRDARNLREKYYRAMDRLYVVAGKLPEYDIKPLRKKTVTPELADFESVYPLDGSYYTFYMLVPLVYEAQALDLRKFLGQDMYGKLTNGTLDGPLMEACRRYVVLKAVWTAVGRWSLEVFPLAVARRFAPTYQGNKSSRAADLKEISWYLDRLEKEIAAAKEEILEDISGRGRYEGYRMLPENDPKNKFFTAQ